MSNNDDQCGCGGDCCDFYPDGSGQPADDRRSRIVGCLEAYMFGLRDPRTGELTLLAVDSATPGDEVTDLVRDVAMVMSAGETYEAIEHSEIPDEVLAILTAHFEARPGPGSSVLVPMPNPVRPRLAVVAGTADAEADEDSCTDPHNEAILMRMLLAYLELDPDKPERAKAARDAALADIGDCPACLRQMLVLAVARLGESMIFPPCHCGPDCEYEADVDGVIAAVESELLAHLDAAAAPACRYCGDTIRADMPRQIARGFCGRQPCIVAARIEAQP